MGSHFAVRNPNAKSACGCGTSFSIDWNGRRSTKSVPIWEAATVGRDFIPDAQNPPPRRGFSPLDKWASSSDTAFASDRSDVCCCRASSADSYLLHRVCRPGRGGIGDCHRRIDRGLGRLHGIRPVGAAIGTAAEPGGGQPAVVHRVLRWKPRRGYSVGKTCPLWTTRAGTHRPFAVRA